MFAAGSESPFPIRLVSTPPSTLPPLPASAPHILLILDQFAATLGGGERIVLRLADLLPKYGFRVSILTLFIDDNSPVLSSPPSCPLYLLPLARTWNLQALRAAQRLRAFLVAQHIQIVHTFFESSDLWAGIIAKTIPGVRLIWSRRDMGILRTAKHRIAYKLLSRLPDRVLAVSEQVRAHCIETDGIPSQRVETLYNGVDLLSAEQFPATDNGKAKTVLAVGNIRPVKGYDILLEAAAIVLRSHPDVTFAIAGEVLDRAHFESLQRRRGELGLSERFRFLGGVTEPAKILEAAMIFVLPSRSEGFSNAIIEAMTASLPVVATNVGGNAEAVDHRRTGLIVPPEDAQSLANAVEHLLKNSIEAETMGAAGRKKAEEMFSTSAMMEQLTSTYKALLRR